MAESEVTTVARPYARAAFSHALNVDNGLAKWSRSLAMLKACFEAPQVRTALENPQWTNEQQQQLLSELMGDDLTPDVANFIGVLAEFDRLALIPTAAEMFEDLKAQYEKTMDVEVISAFEVSAEQASDLADALKRRLQREVKLETSVDESLIGGVVIRADDTVIDDSIRGRLGKLSHVLN